MDTLFYRLPNTEAFVRQSGQMVQYTASKEPNGFVITDFLHQQCYVFELAQETPIEWHSNSDAPFVISQRDYQIEAQALLHGFVPMGVEKAVYSRVKMVPFPIEKSELLFQELCQLYPATFCYLLISEKLGTWIGASPELLLNRSGMQLKTMALAATQQRDEQRDWTVKEIHEHEYVVEALAASLNRNNCVELAINGPYNHDAGPVTHLKTDFSALLTRPNAWQIAMDLHPTPAVCGTPRMQALDLIASREMHQRELYTGIIGIHTEEQSQLFVNLRCAKLFKDKAYLYVGGGFTIDSIPDLEWGETENKAKTLMNAMEAVL